MTAFILGRLTVSSAPNARLETEGLRAEITRLKAENEGLVVGQTSISAPAAPVPAGTDPDAHPVPESTPSFEAPATGSSPDRTIKPWVLSERGAQQIQTAQEVAAFLEKVRIADFFNALSAAKPFERGDEAIEFLNGTYSGSVTPLDGTSVITVLMSATVHVADSGLKGRVSIRLSRDGKTFNRSNSNGNIQNIQRAGENSVSIFISTSDYHFQLYYLPQLESFEGNAYHQWKPGSMKYIGTVHLERA